jgi:hypothetical protein
MYQTGDLLGVNERQVGQQKSSEQFRKPMAVDREHSRAMRLLPFAPAADYVGLLDV